MKYILKSFIFALYLLPSWAIADSVVVIVNANNGDDVTEATVKAIYSDIRNEWGNGKKISLYELPVKASARKSFAKSLLNKSPADAQADWSNRKMNNTIKNRPKVKRDKLVLKFVSKDANAIGYVPASLAAGVAGVKVVMTIQ